MNRIMIVIIILIFLGSGAFIYVLVSDVILIVTNPSQWQENVGRLGHDSGALLLISQSSISSSINVLEENGDIEPTYRYWLNSQIMGGVAFTFLVVLIVFGMIKKIIRSETTSLMSWLFIIFVTLLIVGVLQIVAALVVTGDVVYPFSGIVDLVTHMDTVAYSFMQAVPLHNVTI